MNMVRKVKVLSIKEPYATLICNKKKSIETRSYKTNYRGELYIHASVSKIDKKTLGNKELMDIVDNDTFSYGKIICKCKLVDCIYMTSDYIKEIEKNKQEYTCGYYEVGRYSWVLEDIEPLDIKIDAVGNLGIWNYYTLDDTVNIMDNIEYGYIDNDNKRHTEIDNLVNDNYILQSPNRLLKTKLGLCYDQVELERFLLQKNKCNIETYFMIGKSSKYHTHTFLIFEKDNKYYWLENSWKRFKGIHGYNSKSELMNDVKNKFIKYELDNINNIEIHKYNKPKYNITLEQYNNHCLNGEIYE